MAGGTGEDRSWTGLPSPRENVNQTFALISLPVHRKRPDLGDAIVALTKGVPPDLEPYFEQQSSIDGLGSTVMRILKVTA